MNIFIPVRGRLYKDRANGINQVIYSHAKYLSRLGAEVNILGLCKSSPTKGETVKHEGFKLDAFPKISISQLVKNIKKSDLVCIHGFFDFYLLLNVFICLFFNKRYIVVPHNALDPMFMKKSRLIKYIYRQCFGYILLRNAFFVYCVTQEEETEILTSFGRLKTLVFPNGIDVEDYSRFYFCENKKNKVNEIDAVFVGRISEEKNIENAILAVLEYNNRNVERELVFNIVGPESNYSQFLKDKYKSRYIKFHGPLYGINKFNFMRQCDFMLHPSISEVMSISVIEAMYLRIPVCVSRGSKLTHYYNTNSFFITEPSVNGLLRSLEQFILQSSNWDCIKSNATELVNEKLNWESIVKDFYLEINVNV